MRLHLTKYKVRSFSSLYFNVNQLQINKSDLELIKVIYLSFLTHNKFWCLCPLLINKNAFYALINESLVMKIGSEG